MMWPFVSYDKDQRLLLAFIGPECQMSAQCEKTLSHEELCHPNAKRASIRNVEGRNEEESHLGKRA